MSSVDDFLSGSSDGSDIGETDDTSFNFHNTDQEYDDADYGCGEYLHNGLCPCCGGYVRTIGGNYDNDPMHDECDTCDWRGDEEYD